MEFSFAEVKIKIKLFYFILCTHSAKRRMDEISSLVKKKTLCI